MCPVLVVIVAWAVGAPTAVYLVWTARSGREADSALTAEAGPMVFVALVILVSLIGLTFR